MSVERVTVEVAAPPDKAEAGFRDLRQAIAATAMENREHTREIVASNQDWRQSLQGIQSGVSMVSGALGAMGSAANSAYGYVTGGMRETLRHEENLRRSLGRHQIELEANIETIERRSEAFLRDADITGREYDLALQQVAHFSRGSQQSLAELQRATELSLAAMAGLGEGFDTGIAKAFGETLGGDIAALAGDLPGLRTELERLAAEGASVADVMILLSAELEGTQQVESAALIQTTQLENAIDELRLAFAEAMSSILVDSGALEWFREKIAAVSAELNDPNSGLRQFIDSTVPDLVSGLTDVADAAVGFGEELARWLDFSVFSFDAFAATAQATVSTTATALEDITALYREAIQHDLATEAAAAIAATVSQSEEEFAAVFAEIQREEAAFQARLEQEDEAAAQSRRRPWEVGSWLDDDDRQRSQETARDVTTIADAYGELTGRVRELRDLLLEVREEGPEEDKAAFSPFGLNAAQAVEDKEMVEAMIASLSDSFDVLPTMATDALGDTLGAIGAFAMGAEDAFTNLWSGIGKEAGRFFADTGASFLSAAAQLVFTGAEGPLGILAGAGAAFALLGGLLGGGGSSGSPSGRAGVSAANTLQAIRPEMTSGEKVIIQQKLDVGAIFSARDSAQAISDMLSYAERYGMRRAA